MQDEDFDVEDDAHLTARWWLDRHDPERAAALLGRADSLPTSEDEHRALAAELRQRGLVCLREDGLTWVWTPEDAAELEAEARAQGQDRVVAMTGELEDGRRPARRGPGTTPAGRNRSTR